ncbi:MAG: serine hydrolase domain-containing protein [Salinarimonas sp.]
MPTSFPCDALLRTGVYACFASLALALVDAAPARADRVRAVDALVAPLVGVEAPGVAVLVARDGAILHAAGYGVADLDDGTPVTIDTLFELASVSKQMTALAAALQVEDGTLDPSAPVADVLVALQDLRQGARRPILLEDLVRHTGGLADYLDEEQGLDFDEETTNAEVLAWLAETQPDHEPGTRFAYSNSGYLVLGALVAAADGAESLDAVLQARVFGPLGMRASASGAPADPRRRARGYAGTHGAFEPSEWDTAVEGDGSIWTSLSDLGRYEAALVDGTLLDDESIAILFEDGRLDDGTPIEDEDGAGYGWGWSLYEDGEGRRVAGHGGSWYGTATFYRRSLDTGLAVIVLANGEDLDAETLAEAIAGVLE